MFTKAFAVSLAALAGGLGIGILGAKAAEATGRIAIEITSSTPTKRNTGTMHSSMKPTNFPFGAKMWPRNPFTLFSVSAQ